MFFVQYIINSHSMSKGEVLDQVQSPKMNVHTFSTPLNLPLPISPSLYQNCLILLSQETERLLLQTSTKFLARKYFDLYLCSQPYILEQNLILALITCLRSAVKFSEKPQISNLYTLDYAIEQSEGIYTPQQFLHCENELSTILGDNVDLTTPEKYKQILQLMPEMVTFDKLRTFLDVLLMFPQSRTLNGQQFFVVAFIFWSRKNSAVPHQENIKIIQNISQKTEKCEQFVANIQQTLKSILDE